MLVSFGIELFSDSIPAIKSGDPGRYDAGREVPEASCVLRKLLLARACRTRSDSLAGASSPNTFFISSGTCTDSEFMYFTSSW